MPGRPVAAVLALAFLLPMVAGCVDTAPTATVDPLSTGLADAAVTSYLHDLSEPVEGVTVFNSILEHLQVPAPDGILLDTWIVRPDVDGPVPLVLEVTPYYPGGSPVRDLEPLRTHSLGKLADALVPRGYAVGVSSVRGTGNSEGCFTQGGAEEARDTAALVEALAAEPWSNGNVGIIGVSYPGTTPQDVWIEAPPALKTIVPISGISDFYKYNFVNGVPIDIQGFGFNTYYWVFVGAPGLNGAEAVLDPASFARALPGEACEDQIAVQEGGVSSTVDGNKDAYWQERDFLRELREAPAKARASVFYVHGLQDWNVKPHMMEDWLPALQESGVPVKIWLGQWGHAWPQREDWWEDTLVAWFDQFLKGKETGILDAPRVQVKDDDGKWRHEAEWPPADVDWLLLHPQADGTLADARGTGEVSYHDHAGQPLADGSADGATSLLGEGVALFRSEPLTEDLHLAGLPRYEGHVTASGRRASLLLTLAEELEDGTLRPFNYAALSLNHAAGLEQGRSDISGLPQLVSLRFFPQDDVVHQGSRLVLLASGSLIMEGEPGPSLKAVSDGSTITLTLEGASLSLPVDRTLVYEDPQPEEED